MREIQVAHAPGLCDPPNDHPRLDGTLSDQVTAPRLGRAPEPPRTWTTTHHGNAPLSSD